MNSVEHNHIAPLPVIPSSRAYSPYDTLCSILKPQATRKKRSKPFHGAFAPIAPKQSRKQTNPAWAGLGHDVWQCWECLRTLTDEQDLAEHIKLCRQKSLSFGGLVGCPFCPRDAFHASDVPFSIEAFNTHVTSCHADVFHLTCGYCLLDMKGTSLEDLSHHILSYHRIPWKPSATSLAYLRRDQLPHRVITCLGCGWCTFVLRADNAAQPPTSLETHLIRCPFKGGRVCLDRTAAEMCDSESGRLQIFKTSNIANQSSKRASPLIRSYANDTSSCTSRPLNLHYRRRKSRTPKLFTMRDSVDSSSHHIPTRRRVALKRPRSKSFKLTAPMQSVSTTYEQRINFDVPVTLLLPQSATSKSSIKNEAPVCLYVCPLCGDNALESLRSRDEHIQSSHNGELVFPCQICGLAYPLYIALRRHAALKHNADYDLVRYGPPELLDSESIECPECKLVAFTDQAVLKLHLVGVHNMDAEQANARVQPGGRKSQTGTPGRTGSRTGRRVGRPPKNPGKPTSKDRTLSARAEKHRPRPVSLSHLERVLSNASGKPAPTTCRLCRATVDNEKEFKLHMELDHLETEECEQLGCQACGRIFFGPGGRIDLIGHLRVLHQDATQSSALSCPQAEEKPVEKVTEDGTSVLVRPCEAMFSSPRLRQLHSVTCRDEHPGFACPLALELPDSENQDTLDLSDQLKAAIMETESAADREGLMILAYCCPNCSRLFAGFQAPMRFDTHRLTCQIEPEVVSEVAPATAEQPVPTAEIRQDSTTRLLESVLRQEPNIPIKR